MRLLSSPRSFISRYMQGFFAKRAPQRDDATLTLRNVYIFFSREGFFYALLLLITFVTGVNYGNNLILGMFFYLTSIWVISLHLTFAHISGLQLSLQQTTLTQAGQPAWVTIDITNNKSKPCRQIKLAFDNRASEEGKDASTLSESELSSEGIPSTLILTSLQGTETIKLPVTTIKRGKMVLPRLIITTVYPIGIMKAWSYVYFDSPVWVYPAPIAFEWTESYVVASDDDSEWSTHVMSGQDDFDSLDEYVAGESLARISWAHVARGQGMLTKNFANTMGREIRLDYSDMPAVNHEDKLGQLTHAVLQMGATATAFQLILPEDHGAIGQGESFVQACLLRLAKAP